jgi:leucyl-tRNA synthetase
LDRSLLSVKLNLLFVFQKIGDGQNRYGAKFMDEKYFAKKIEEKWQKHWAETGYFETEMDERPKFYQLEMLPYPSGYLHMGHVRNYSVGDAMAWFKRLQGFNVLHPIGWDSFGQPAEDAAIKRGVNPREWTEENIVHMSGQLQRMGFSYDWRRQTFAHRPDFYKFDQWFFLKMYEMGLAYKKKTQVNWCPHDEAVLSNEQASGGLCWRCGNPVTKKELAQWFFKITDYADQLLDDMSEIEDGWAPKVLKRQRDWIGRSEGAYVSFRVTSKDVTQNEESIRVFTTRIDTIYGASAVVVAAEHPIIDAHFSEFDENIRRVIEKIKADKLKVTDYDVEPEKEGIDTGLKAVNPFGGEELPVWVGNYVMMEYGTGAVMSVPAHDERDFEFASKYGLKIPRVIESNESIESVGSIESKENSHDSKDSSDATDSNDLPFVGYGVLINSGGWSGKTSEDAKREMAAYAKDHGFGEAATTFRIRDWGVSRQRYWGAPIPIIYCEKCGTVPVPFDQLPVELPENVQFGVAGESPLATVLEFVNTTCPACGGAATRETDTMDTFVDSCWYYFRYLDNENTELPFAPEKAAYWTPVDQYIGGDDHAVMHLIYTRFWTKVMRDIGLVKFDEPVKRLLTQGMVVGETFFDDETGKKIYHMPADVAVERDGKGKLTAVKSKDGKSLKWAIERMSKSKGNGVDPDEMVEIYGADAARLFILFAAPVENELVWHESGVEGTVRFLQRVWRFVWKWKEKLSVAPSAPSADAGNSDIKKLRQKTHQTIKRITENLETLQFNTPVAALMELCNALYDLKVEPQTATPEEVFAVREAVEALLLMMAPFAPHAAEEMFSHIVENDNGMLRNGKTFPVADENLVKADVIEIPVQVNGKLRSRVIASPETPNAELEAMALADEKIREFTAGKEIVKVIVVPKRLVSIVIKG